MLRRPFLFLFSYFKGLRSENTRSINHVYGLSSKGSVYPRKCENMRLDGMGKGRQDIMSGKERGKINGSTGSEDAIIGLEY
jgi:hypothetical protein